MRLTREESRTLMALLDGRIQELERLCAMYEMDFPSLFVLYNIREKAEAYTGILPPKEDQR